MQHQPFRLDRLITVSLFYPLHRIWSSTRIRKIPLLMYHGITDEPEVRSHPYFKTNTTPAVFREQMRFLRQAGYQSITLDSVVEGLHGSGILPPKPVVITFDDGLKNFYTEAYPALREHGLSAVMFLPTAFISPEKKMAASRSGVYLSWNEVREMHREGIAFGSHTAHHYHLVELGESAIQAQLEESRIAIERELGVTIDTFSYPYKFPEHDRRFVTMFVELLKKTGYRCGVSTRIGTTSSHDNIYYMRRLPVNDCDDPRFLLAKLEGCYDWLHRLQYTTKVLRGALRRKKR